MRLQLAAAVFSSGLWSLAGAHDHHSNEGYAEPFVGWTQEDLDAKWGTDVCYK